MKAILICPSQVTTVVALEKKRPLALLPFLGETVIEYALAGLAAAGYRHVQISAPDRANEIKKVVGNGEAWGLKVELTSKTGEALLQEAQVEGTKVILLEALPQLPLQPLWHTYHDWHRAQTALIPLAAPQQVGMREIAPKVFAHLKAKISPDVVLRGPAWIGAGVLIRPGATIGDGTIVEEGSYIDDGASLTGSIIGPWTYVGKYTEIIDSFAWGNNLLSLETGSLAELTDPFLLSEVKIRKGLAGGLLDVFRSITFSSRGKQTGTDDLSGADFKVVA